MKRPLLLSITIFKNVDRIIQLGIWIGVVGGLGVALGCNLFLSHIFDSYQQFVQQSLIGARGTLYVEGTPYLLEETLLTHEEIRSQPHTFVWESGVPISVRLKQGDRNKDRRITVTIVEERFLQQQMIQHPSCSNSESSVPTIYGNSLLLLAVEAFDLNNSMQLSIPSLELNSKSFNISTQKKCVVDTGMMTDYPMLFLTFESISKQPTNWNTKVGLKFYSSSRVKTQEIKALLEEALKQTTIALIRKNPDRSINQLYYTSPKSVYDSDELKLANNIADQAEQVSKAILIFCSVLSLFILFFGFSLLLAIKSKVIDIVSKMGANHHDIALSFGLKGLYYGVWCAMISGVSAFLLKQVVMYTQWIPFPDFFQNWDLQLCAIALAVLVTVFGALSLITSFFSLKTKHLMINR